MLAEFIHLRVHSAYSLSEGAIRLKELGSLCRDHGMPAVAVTDTGNLFGALEFAEAVSAQGVQPIIGCLVAVRRNGGKGEARPGALAARPDRLVLLVQDAAGYANLMALVSRAFLDTPAGEEAQVTLDDLAAASAGLICLTGGHAGPVGRLLLEGARPAAEAYLRRLAAIFPGRCYVEIQRHGLPDQRRCEDGLIELAYALSLPLVATNDCHFADAAMYEAHDALLCIAEGVVVEARERRRLTPEHRFKSAAEMKALFADLPEAIENTVVIARRCAYFPEKRKPILPRFSEDEAAELRRQAAEGLELRLACHVWRPEMDAAAREEAAAPYRQRLAHELDVIERCGFPGYFLIVADFIKWAKAQGIPVGPGRGSGAASVVAWSLTITDLDPLRWSLLFERFLNVERVSMPDFDIDFCQDRRDQVLTYVQERYGHDRVAQIITFGKLQARAVLRDVGRVLGLPFPVVDRICKLVPNNPANPVTLRQAIDKEPELQRQRDSDEQVGRMIAIGLQLEGLYRHASTHAAGVVIGDRPLQELVPLYRDPKSDWPVTQFNMKDVEKAGLVKFDFLGLKTLTVLKMAVDLIGQDIDLNAIPLDDPATFRMLSRAEATGVFQLESGGMRDVLRKLKPDRFEDIIAVVALYRPGPMDNIPSYINRKHGVEKPDYLHPWLEPVLRETYGIPIYQEQVLQIAQVLSGYSLGSADLLRRAMGKKIKEEMDAQRKDFVEGAVAKGVDQAKASEIFDVVAKFAGYGFNKAHAAAYALVSYQTAWLKANHPVEFMAATMTYDMANTDKLTVFRQELARLEIPLLPPDVNRSQRHFSVELLPDGRKAIRYALAAIRNVGAQAMEDLCRVREAGGPFRSIADFARRMDHRQINKRQLENLVGAGAFDALEPNRARLFEGLDVILRHAAAAAESRGSDQMGMFGGVEEAPLRLPDKADWPALERLKREFEAIGFYLSAHPLDGYEASLHRVGAVSQDQLAALAASGTVRAKLAGVVISRQERTSSRSGNRYAFVTLSDRTGVYEVMVFGDRLAAHRDDLEPGATVLIGCSLTAEGEDVKLMANTIEPLDKAVAGVAAGLTIQLGSRTPLPLIASILDQQGSGRGRVRLVVDIDRQEVTLALRQGYQISAGLRGAIKSLPGVLDVRDT
ncbi:MAG: DNA polymerase III subunit alpha [Thalassobaculales bacterium]